MHFFSFSSKQHCSEIVCCEHSLLLTWNICRLSAGLSDPLYRKSTHIVDRCDQAQFTVPGMDYSKLLLNVVHITHIIIKNI